MATEDLINGTTPTQIDATIPEIWGLRVYHEFQRHMRCALLMGSEGSDMAIIVKRELERGPGDIIHVEKRLRLESAGVSGDTTVLKGNEETLQFSQVDLTPVLYRHGVGWYKRAKKKSISELRTEAKMALAEWAAELVDDSFFDAAMAGSNVLFAGSAAGSGDLTGESLMTADDIDRAGTYLRDNKVPQVAMTDRYVALISPRQGYHLGKDDAWIKGKREADLRGKLNPVFAHFIEPDYLGDYQGVSVFETHSVPLVDGAVSGHIQGALVMGAEAFAFAVGDATGGGKIPINWEEESSDYNNIKGIAVELVFESKLFRDESLVRVYTAGDLPSLGG
ncbi:MAG: N4-gp56 family major capsid protein [Deltaproteobacteria bacterium]|nr:N4-gp56 family major capsid protein [Candidatus Zymogenaceae bacterium]